MGYEAHETVAQSEERLLCKQEVRGSNPLSSTSFAVELSANAGRLMTHE